MAIKIALNAVLRARRQFGRDSLEFLAALQELQMILSLV